MQRKVAETNGVADVPPLVHDVLHSPGQLLDPATRAFMERRFGHDFSQVRVHTDAMAARSADSVGAAAYTVGREVVFAQGQYAPATNKGRRLLSHELTHVLQQRGAERTGDLALADSDSNLEREAETFESRVAQANFPDRAPMASPRHMVSRKEPPVPTTEDCSDDQTRMLTGHLAAARTWVNDAAPKVVSYAYFHANPRVTAVPASPNSLDVVRNALRDNFHTTRNGVLSIRDGFTSLRTALNNSITFECEDEGCADQAYVRGAIAPIRRLGDIHVCPPWFNCRDYYRRVTTLIHERAHQYPGATDNSYEWESSYATLPIDDAIDNAESYAVAARQIYHGGARGPSNPAC